MKSKVKSEIHELKLEKPIRGTFKKEDLILRLSGSMGSEFSYILIENISRERLEQIVREYVSLSEKEKIDENKKPLESYLQDKGATITPLYDSSGYGENYPITFYDVEYDADTGITCFSDLTLETQAEMVMQKADFPRNK